MTYLLFDPSDPNYPYALFEERGVECFSYAWFNPVAPGIWERSQLPANYSVERYLSNTPWSIITTFQLLPSEAELTSYFHDHPELCI